MRIQNRQPTDHRNRKKQNSENVNPQTLVRKADYPVGTSQSTPNDLEKLGLFLPFLFLLDTGGMGSPRDSPLRQTKSSFESFESKSNFVAL